MHHPALSVPARRSTVRTATSAIGRESTLRRCRTLLALLAGLLALLCAPAGAIQEESSEPPPTAQEGVESPDSEATAETEPPAPEADAGLADAAIDGDALADAVAFDTQVDPRPRLSLSDRFSLTVEERPLGEVLSVLAQHYDVNFIVGQGLRNRVVSVYLREVELDAAINGLLQAADLSYSRIAESNLFVIKEQGQAPAALVTQTIRLKYLRLDDSEIGPEPSPLASNAASVASWSAGQTPGDDDFDPRIASTARLVEVVRSVLSEHGSVRVEVSTNSLVVTDQIERIAEAQKMVARLDIGVLVLIHVEIVGGDSGAIDRVGMILQDAEGALGRRQEAAESVVAEGQVFTAPSRTFDLILQSLQAEADSRYRSQRLKLLTLNSQATRTEVRSEPPTAIGSGPQLAPELMALAGAEPAGFELEVIPDVNDDGSVSLKVQIQARPGQSNPSGRLLGGEARIGAAARVEAGHSLLIGGFQRPNEGAEPSNLASVNGSVHHPGPELMVLITPEVVSAAWMQAN